ncbi:hypothetical protein GGS23DRAFT_608221 [Durotheca rogersii]|uniref:uncharacterized protein n=1 Tax=Durotheca rogersii TaxID=419775 RepID=UPI00221F1C80|nr:uncharacterized protein GGS23DRAFT_608221 [Durotheca rogersii]KAI5855104.1 hypothetical protein GGS23DRAFT_608221 [Durotheca rogersii]
MDESERLASRRFCTRVSTGTGLVERGAGDVLDDLLDDYLESPSSHHSHEPPARVEKLKLEVHPPEPSRQLSIPFVPSPSAISFTSSNSRPVTPNSNASRPVTPNSNWSIWKAAVDETIYFAGGLISHPFESTKHYTILRHSAGLVMYRGPSTSIAITIFADKPLPADRSLWLQRKGFSGDLGMAASALLRTQGDWIDVTPSREALPSDIPASDERAWQRDVKKFVKKAASRKSIAKHTIRETCIVRIPASAEDGYLRIVMCTGEGSKKTLCPSPVFRVASTSSDVSVMRGASLKTMPIEIGLKVASIVGQNTVDRFIGPARDIIQSQVERIQDKVEQLQPGFVKQEVGMIAYARSGLQDRFGSLEEGFDATRDVTYEPFHAEGDLEAPPEIVGADSGPEKPFPISLRGKVIEGTGRSWSEVGVPTANLFGVPEDMLLRLKGVYMGWVAVQGFGDISDAWHEAIIVVGPSPYATPRVIIKNVVAVHIIHDFGGARFFNANLQVVIMAYLRPTPLVDRSQPLPTIAATVAQDINVAVASLSRENWQCDMTIRRAQTEKNARTIEERYIEVRSQIQKRVNSVPLHRAGVRTAGAELKDVAHGRGGLYIRR